MAKIIRLEANGVIYEVGKREPFTERVIAEIIDSTWEYPDSVVIAYEINDKKGNRIARLENGAYVIWYEEAVNDGEKGKINTDKN